MLNLSGGGMVLGSGGVYVEFGKGLQKKIFFAAFLCCFFGGIFRRQFGQLFTFLPQ